MGLLRTVGGMDKRSKRVGIHELEHFGAELERWVKEACDGNQTAAGKLLGVSQGHISAMIQGSRGPGLPTLIALRAKTGRSIDDLLGLRPLRRRPDSEPPSPEPPTPPPSLASLASDPAFLQAVRDALREEMQAEPPSTPKKGPRNDPPSHPRRRP